MELVIKKDEGLAKYEELLIKRDILMKDAGSYLTAYICEFGQLITAVFEAQVECIKKKKSIAFCLNAINRGEKPDAAELHEFIERNMKEYYEQLDEMIKDNEKCMKSKTFSKVTVNKCKEKFRRIAKLIHPDINPSAAGDKKIIELWQRTVEAHNHNDLKTLEELIVLVESAVKNGEINTQGIVIPDIEEKIIQLEAEVEEIVNTTPYTYGSLLNDFEKIDQLKTELQLELEEYEKYSKELDEVLADFEFAEVQPCRMN